MNGQDPTAIACNITLVHLQACTWAAREDIVLGLTKEVLEHVDNTANACPWQSKKYLLTWFRSDKLNHFYDNWLPIFLYNTPLIDKSSKNIFGYKGQNLKGFF